MKLSLGVSRRSAKFIDANTSDELFRCMAEGNYAGQVAPKVKPGKRMSRAIAFTKQQEHVIKALAKEARLHVSVFLENAIHYYSDSRNRLCEDWYQDRLHKRLGGQREVVLEGIGRLDLKTSDKIIELKYARPWKHALGQILAYAYFLPHHQPCLGLIGDRIQLVEDVCKRYNVEVMWLSCSNGELIIK